MDLHSRTPESDSLAGEGGPATRTVTAPTTGAAEPPAETAGSAAGAGAGAPTTAPALPLSPPPALGERSPLEILEALIAVTATAAAPPGPEASERILLQDWRTVNRSLEWFLSERSWTIDGLQAFVRGDVPYVVNNTAWVAECAAATLLESWTESHPGTERICILELGAGLGLFARQFLDALQGLCRERERDDYDRLTYYVTDGSSRTVRAWAESELFRAHQDHVVVGTCDARTPRRIVPVSILGQARSEPIDLPACSLHGILANYLLDGLPATVVHFGPGTRDEELRVRVHLETAAQAEIKTRFGLEVEDLRRLVREAERAMVEPPSTREFAAGTAAKPDPWTSLLPYLTFEAAYHPLNDSRPDLEALRVLHPSGGWAILSHGAIDCLDACVPLLRDSAVILYRDLGPVTFAATSARPSAHVLRFGPTLAAVVNFPLLDAHLQRRGLRVIAPPGDDTRAIHTRLAVQGSQPETERVFAERFGQDHYGRVETLSAEAESHSQAGRLAEALAAYRQALELCPTDWHLLGQIAQFLTQRMLRAAEARVLAGRALQINPSFSAFLWNTLGNCEFSLGNLTLAHEAYSKARAIDEDDPQSHLNLAYTQAAFGNLEEALLALARGLACDADARFQLALMTKQREVIARIEQRYREERDRLVARHASFASGS